MLLKWLANAILSSGWREGYKQQCGKGQRKSFWTQHRIIRQIQWNIGDKRTKEAGDSRILHFARFRLRSSVNAEHPEGVQMEKRTQLWKLVARTRLSTETHVHRHESIHAWISMVRWGHTHTYIILMLSPCRGKRHWHVGLAGETRDKCWLSVAHALAYYWQIRVAGWHKGLLLQQ